MAAGFAQLKMSRSPAISTTSASGMLFATYRASSARAGLCPINVGAFTDGSTSRTSPSISIRMNAAAAPGLALRRM